MCLQIFLILLCCYIFLETIKNETKNSKKLAKFKTQTVFVSGNRFLYLILLFQNLILILLFLLCHLEKNKVNKQTKKLTQRFSYCSYFHFSFWKKGFFFTWFLLMTEYSTWKKIWLKCRISICTRRSLGFEISSFTS